MSGAESGAGSAAGSEAGSAAESGQRVRQNLHRMVNRNYGKPVLSGLSEILVKPVFCFTIARCTKKIAAELCIRENMHDSRRKY